MDNNIIDKAKKKINELKGEEETSYEKAKDLFNKALNAKNNEQAKKIAKEAYDTCPEYFETLLLLASLEEDSIKREKILFDGLAIEEKRLKKLGYYVEGYIGLFYEIVEARPYIKGLYTSACYLALEGKLLKSKEACKKIIKLNKKDILGARYVLMAIYSSLEDEKSLLALNDSFNEKSFKMLMPLLVYYYKKCDYEKAMYYINEIKQVNKDFIDFYQGKIRINEEIPEGFYMQGDCSEILMYYEDYRFLMDTVPALKDFVLSCEE